MDQTSYPKSISNRLVNKRINQLQNILGNGYRIQIPARVGYCVKDMTAFHPGKAGGGGIGLAVNLFSTTNVFVSGLTENQHTHILKGECTRTALIKHHVEVFRVCLAQILGIPSVSFACFIQHQPRFGSHCGLGSTSGVALGVLHGLNECFGKPFNDEDIRFMLADNYVEENKIDSEEVSFGYETTMTAVGSQNGGCFIIDENSLDILSRISSYAWNDLPVFLFAPHKSHEVNESQVLQKGADRDAEENEATKKHRLFEKLRAELNQNESVSIDAVGDLVFALQQSGSKRTEVESHSRFIYPFMEAIKILKCTHIVGMSSVGPIVAVVCSKGTTKADLNDAAENHRMVLIDESVVNTSGRRTEKLPDLKWVHVIGKPCSGKTTLCKELANTVVSDDSQPNLIKHFLAGPYLRELAKSNPIIAEIIKNGKVKDPKNLCLKPMLDRLFLEYFDVCRDKTVCFLLDGFPRSVEQLKIVVKDYSFLKTFLCVLHIVAPDDVRMARQSSRAPRVVGSESMEEADLARRDGMDETSPMIDIWKDECEIQRVHTVVNTSAIEVSVSCMNSILSVERH